VNTNRREGDENKASELIEKADISRNILPTQLGEIESYYHGFADPEFFAMRVAYLRLLFRRNKGPNVNPFPPQSASTLLNVQGLTYRCGLARFVHLVLNFIESARINYFLG
jgi:hypothetical protein